jgi:hypothetical protein
LGWACTEYGRLREEGDGLVFLSWLTRSQLVESFESGELKVESFESGGLRGERGELSDKW